MVGLAARRVALRSGWGGYRGVLTGELRRPVGIAAPGGLYWSANCADRARRTGWRAALPTSCPGGCAGERTVPIASPHRLVSCLAEELRRRAARALTRRPR